MLNMEQSLDALLPKSLLDGLVSSFEAIFALDGAIALRYTNDQLCYGPDFPADQRTTDAAILVNGQEVGRVGFYGVPADTSLTLAIQHLALSLSHIATQAWRERHLSSEVLQRYDELNLIYDLGSAFTQGLSQDEIIEAVLNETNRIMQAEAGVIYIWDGARSDLTPVSYFGDDHDLEFWQGRMRELALSTLYAYQDAQLFEGNQVICAPLRHNDGLVGSLMLVYEEPDKQFTANDIHLLSTLSHNTALFIEAARLYDQLTQRNTELEATLVELKSTRDKLSRAERLSIIGQTVSGLIHDMKSPLGIIMGYAGLLQEPDINFDQRYDFACQIIRHIEAFSAMAQEILDYIQGDENIQKTRVELCGYLAQIHNLLVTPGLQRPAEIVVNCEAARGSDINVDPQRFARVFQNLVNNALDAIGSKGGSRIEISAELDGDWVRFMVTDDGPGVPPDLADAIFEPFVTHGKRHGTGLGLAIVRRMVAIHGGEIHYEPAPGRGARFVFTLPLATDAHKLAKAREGAGKTGDKNESESVGYLALVVEDDKLYRLMLERILNRVGFQVLHAADGKQALHFLEQHTPLVVFLDIMLPGVMGTVVLEHIRNTPHLKDTYVVIVTARNEFNADQSAAQPHEFLHKPVHPMRIVEAAQRALSTQVGR